MRIVKQRVSVRHPNTGNVELDRFASQVIQALQTITESGIASKIEGEGAANAVTLDAAQTSWSVDNAETQGVISITGRAVTDGTVPEQRIVQIAVIPANAVYDVYARVTARNTSGDCYRVDLIRTIKNDGSAIATVGSAVRSNEVYDAPMAACGAGINRVGAVIELQGTNLAQRTIWTYEIAVLRNA